MGTACATWVGWACGVAVAAVWAILSPLVMAGVQPVITKPTQSKVCSVRQNARLLPVTKVDIVLSPLLIISLSANLTAAIGQQYGSDPRLPIGQDTNG